MIKFHESMIENSFKDYHVKGFDYICLMRTPELTRKVYFFDGIAGDLPEVVCPHNHRYDFVTHVLAGNVINYTFEPSQLPGVEIMQRFHYRTPLNGGNGFTWMGEQGLFRSGIGWYRAGYKYLMNSSDIHTIKTKSDTILMLDQFSDEPVEHTTTWTRSREPINLSGLYNKFTADQIIKRLKQLEGLI